MRRGETRQDHSFLLQMVVSLYHQLEKEKKKGNETTRVKMKRMRRRRMTYEMAKESDKTEMGYEDSKGFKKTNKKGKTPTQKSQNSKQNFSEFSFFLFYWPQYAIFKQIATSIGIVGTHCYNYILPNNIHYKLTLIIEISKSFYS